jgi:hypothetical protein
MEISKSLAARGRPEMWATADEAATLCGMSANEFWRRQSELEALGLPPINHINGKRYIPHILAVFEKTVATGERAMTTAVLKVRERLRQNLKTPDEIAFKKELGFLANDNKAVEFSLRNPDWDGVSPVRKPFESRFPPSKDAPA